MQTNIDHLKTKLASSQEDDLKLVN